MTIAAIARTGLGALFLSSLGVGQRAETPSATPEPSARDSEFWETDIAAARKRAIAAHQPMLVVFRCES
jgi:hypothetical protein